MEERCIQVRVWSKRNAFVISEFTLEGRTVEV
jgi:hypothetical protein